MTVRTGVGVPALALACTLAIVLPAQVAHAQSPTRSAASTIPFAVPHDADPEGATSTAIPGITYTRPLGAGGPRVSRPRITARWDGSTEPAVGETIRLSGALRNGAVEQASVRLERRSGDRWRTALTRPVADDGTWSVLIAPARTPGPVDYRVTWLQHGRELAQRQLPPLRIMAVHTYDIRTRGALTADAEEFARVAARTFADERGWAAAYRRIEPATGGRSDFTLWLAHADELPTFSDSCSREFSCRVGRDVVINETPWLHKTAAFTSDLTAYRRMVINHEVGHWLGLGHRGCGERGAPAPVMMQQSKSLGGCRPNPWPLPAELRTLHR